MTRIDRKTGEPILSPKLTVDQLYAMANEPGWRPWMRLIAEHPNAWPELVDWWRDAREHGFDAAGAAPKPPESMRGRRRVAIPAAPLPPENGGGPEDATADPDDGPEPVPATPEEEPAAEPAPSTPEPEEEGDATPRDAEPDRREEPDPDGVREALDDADGDFAALEQVADTEPATMDIPPLPEPVETETPTDDGTEADDDPFADVKVRRAIPWKTIGIIVAVLIAIGLVIGGGAILARHHGEETARRTLAQEAADCRQAHDTADGQRDALEKTVEKARRLTSATGKDQVTDQSTLDALDKLADETIPELPSCPASNPDAGNVTAAGEEYKRRAEDLADAMDKVNRSILDKTVRDAKTLHDESAGKVADESTRADLAKAMEGRDADAIRKAMDKVNQSIKAKEETDKAKEDEARAQAEAQAAQQQAQQFQQSTGGQTTRRTGGSTSGGTGGRTNRGTTGQSTTPAPSTPSTPSTPTPQPTPSKPSGTDGATVG
ncbi:hypothetical protein KTF54_04500 [Bifidobacterium longum]|nr:hypothetical protein [Bifidobacterium longum]MBU9086408.1 hypothetical protein [Bifidobacterium longum]